MSKTLGLIVFVVAISCVPAFAGDDLLEDAFSEYLQRSETITPNSGNAKEVNAATHIVDPWPRYVGWRRIPINGQRMVGAVDRYRDVKRLNEAAPPISQVDMGAASATGAGTGR
jgi:hypothetical protein